MNNRDLHQKRTISMPFPPKLKMIYKQKPCGQNANLQQTTNISSFVQTTGGEPLPDMAEKRSQIRHRYRLGSEEMGNG
jgi:hypothetical protein